MTPWSGKVAAGFQPRACLETTIPENGFFFSAVVRLSGLFEFGFYGLAGSARAVVE